MKKFLLCCFAALLCNFARAQQTFPVNGVQDIRPGLYAFTNATIVVNSQQTIPNGTLLIKDRIIESVGTSTAIPKGYVVVNLKGKYVYPGLIDAYTTYGLPETPRQAFGGRTITPLSTKPGAYNWNEAIRPEMNVKSIFHVDGAKAEAFKKNGFGAVQSLIHDGIARGTSVVATLGDERDNLVMLNDEAAANYSFSKGTAATNYPSSLMGSIALIRQTYLDAQWYGSQKEEYNISLAEFNREQSLPQIFEVSDPLMVLRADKIAKEFGKKYIYKTDGDEYRRLDAMKATGGSFIIPLTFPDAFDVEDPLQARKISYEQLKDWELAPNNPAMMEKAGIRFAITSYGLSNPREFWTNLRTAIDHGLSEAQALRSLTETPAEMLGVSDKVGTLSKGKIANFLITSDDLFKKGNVIYENWIEGRQYIVSRVSAINLAGTYKLSGDGLAGLNLRVTGNPGSYELSVQRTGGTDSVRTRGTFIRTGDMVTLYFDLKNNPAGTIRLNGYISSTSPVTLTGGAILPDGTSTNWSAVYSGTVPATERREAPKSNLTYGPVVYPFTAYGNAEIPKAENVLFKNATVWTNEKEGILKNADVLIENGKIKAVGKNLPAGNAKVIDATGKHITAGIVDEHSHIAATGGINEGTQAVTSEVRIADVLDSEDINLYRQLAGGVTTSHILHGSANPIGGQTMLIKHRWGMLPEQLKLQGAPGFIKFALGENVKQSNFHLPG
ncbi:MAG TPA: amidohydrolase family protein, partial [Mucilaginibacter sp.]